MRLKPVKIKFIIPEGVENEEFVHRLFMLFNQYGFAWMNLGGKNEFDEFTEFKYLNYDYVDDKDFDGFTASLNYKEDVKNG